MSNLAIVAIPKEDDYVNKISSEQIPHLTLLFLGETDKINNLDQIISFVKHTSDLTLNKFGLEVDHRGILGPELADVIFFSKSKWSGFDIINAFRSNLLKENNIRLAYDSTDQFPEWVPHLTLGYPISPAKPDDRDYPGINYVEFDRIAIWFGEYEGVEIPLNTYDFDVGVAHMLSHTGTYDPVQAHEYYIRTRHLKGHHNNSPRSVTVRSHTRIVKPTYTVKTKSGTQKLTQQRLIEEQAYAEHRVNEIKIKLADLVSKLNKILASAKTSKPMLQKKSPTAAQKSKNVRRALLYSRAHKTQLAAKAKLRRQTHPKQTHQPKQVLPAHNVHVAELERKINEVKNHLQAAVATQKALLSATKNG